MRTILVIILIPILALTACRKNVCGFGEYSLQGKWRWIETSGGLGGIVETPASTGNEIYLELLNDNTYILSKNKVVPIYGTYKLSSQFCYHSNRYKSAIQLDSNQVLTIESLNQSQLTLAEEFADGLTYKYTR